MRWCRSVLTAALVSMILPSSLYAQTKTIGVLPARIEKEMAQGRRYALLIGIGKYQDKRIPKLVLYCRGRQGHVRRSHGPEPRPLPLEERPAASG